MRRGTPIVLLAATLTWAACPSAAVYQWVDEQGNVVYTDNPGGGAEPVELPPLSTVPAPSFSPSLPSSEDRAEELDYSKLSILSPTQDATLRDNTGAVDVNVVLEPDLNGAVGHRFQYYLDGQAQGKTTESAWVSFTNVDRGTHNLEVAVVDSSGRELIRSDSVRFHLHRHSINFSSGPGRPSPIPRPSP